VDFLEHIIRTGGFPSTHKSHDHLSENTQVTRPVLKEKILIPSLYSPTGMHGAWRGDARSWPCEIHPNEENSHRSYIGVSTRTPSPRIETCADKLAVPTTRSEERDRLGAK
jgi:hypothetical protein